MGRRPGRFDAERVARRRQIATSSIVGACTPEGSTGVARREEGIKGSVQPDPQVRAGSDEGSKEGREEGGKGRWGWAQ